MFQVQSLFTEFPQNRRDQETEKQFKNKIDRDEYNDKKTRVIATSFYKIQAGGTVENTDHICLENIVHLGLPARNPFRVVEVKNIVGEQIAGNQKEKKLHVLIQFFVKPDRFLDDTETDEEAEFLIKTQKICEHK